MRSDIEEKKLVVEIISTFAHLKEQLVDMILEPDGIKKEIYSHLFRQKNQFGKFLSKREIAPKIIETIEN
ncbi:hypothetical protein [Paenibacillus sp. SI8]|uniref:hypothetical protein n=1 Tax=unclassified Paenibacillus TaxID=185978 RepID=UPI00346644A8